MSKNYAILEKSAPQALALSDCVSSLVGRFFSTPAALAIVSRGASHLAGDVALELAASGKRVIIVQVSALLAAAETPVPRPTAYVAGPAVNIWTWPPPSPRRFSFFKIRRAFAPVNWLESLRMSFDAVLLDCPAPAALPGAAAIAALADAAILAVEAGAATDLELRQDCRLLQAAGVKLAGSILTRRK